MQMSSSVHDRNASQIGVNGLISEDLQKLRLCKKELIDRSHETLSKSAVSNVL